MLFEPDPDTGLKPVASDYVWVVVPAGLLIAALAWRSLKAQTGERRPRPRHHPGGRPRTGAVAIHAPLRGPSDAGAAGVRGRGPDGGRAAGQGMDRDHGPPGAGPGDRQGDGAGPGDRSGGRAGNRPHPAGRPLCPAPPASRRVAEAAYEALLVVSFGGPEGPDEVMPFLENVLRGRPVPPARLDQVAQHYYRFGGVSPINGQNRALISALSAELERHGPRLPIYWGNRNWHPYRRRRRPPDAR